MGLNFKYPVGATPLDDDEAAGLIPAHITTQEQLNQWEFQNVSDGIAWAKTRHRTNILSFRFMKLLHRNLFGRTWRWSGKRRTTEKTIGIAPENIEVEIKKLCDDVQAQLGYKSLPLDEIAARFHHRLVAIHPFPNGNGRFSRVLTDMLLVQNGERPFTWGSDELISDGETRERYISALRAADGKNYAALLDFVRSKQG